MGESRHTEMEPIVPTISHGVAGPLGIAHLPRVWLKVLLHAVGRLPEGFRYGTGGMDEAMFRELGIEPAEFVAFVESELPSYPECERWVREHVRDLDAEKIARTNDKVLRRRKPPAAARAQRTFVGIGDDVSDDTTLMNDLDDWTVLHALITKGAIPPLISSSLNGALSNLLKDLLDASGARRTAIRIDLPSFGLMPEQPFVQVRRPGPSSSREDAHEANPDAPDVAFVRRERTMLAEDGRMVGPVFASDALAAWISVHDDGVRTWTERQREALRDALERAAEIFETVIRGGI